jgi:hypothetical protein
MEDVGIWLYRIDRCGYYPWRSDDGNAAPFFGGTSQTFAQLLQWANGKQLGQTATLNLASDDESTQVYFVAAEHHPETGDYLVCTWNRFPGNRQNVSSIGVGDVVGAVTSQITEVDENRIPGYATYFWVMPSAARVATINLKHPNKGLGHFANYVQSFLKFINPTHVVLADEQPADGTVKIAGFRSEPGADVFESTVKPLFNVRSIPLGGDIAMLRAHVSEIDKIECKTIIRSTSGGDMARWQTLMELSRLARRPPPRREDTMIRFEVPMEFTLEELNATIEEWSPDPNHVGDTKSDIGFHVRGGRTKWLSRSQARKTFPLDVEWVDRELVNMHRLMIQLQRHRDEVLRMG